MVRIIFENENFIAVEKPAGFLCHPPENKQAYYNPRLDLQVKLGKMFDKPLFPVHRLDKDTSGIVLYAFNKLVANEFNQLFAHRKVTKTYIAVVRGWVLNDQIIQEPLQSDSSAELLEAETQIFPIAHIEIPIANCRHPSSRYTLLKVLPNTGRYHQIRRHCQFISHPIIGDKTHGDQFHNKLFEREFKIKGLLLRAQNISFSRNEGYYQLRGNFKHQWHQVLSLIHI